MVEWFVGKLITAATRLLTGAQARWIGCAPLDAHRVYFANHTSHVDFVLIWAALPDRLRKKTRPVAALDYWSRGALKRYLVNRVFRGVLVSRDHIEREQDRHHRVVFKAAEDEMPGIDGEGPVLGEHSDSLGITAVVEDHA